MELKNLKGFSFLVGGILLMGSTSLMAASSFVSYPFGRDDFKVPVERYYPVSVPEKLVPAFQPLTQEISLDGKSLIRAYEAATSAPQLSVFKECLKKTHSLDLTDQNFSENPELWAVLCKSEELSGLRTLNISHSRYNADLDVNAFLAAFLRNPYLNSLIKIKAVNTNVSLETLQKVKDIKVEPYFVRDMEQISGRYDKSVAVIRIDITGSPLGKDKWQELRDLEKPEREVAVRYRACPSEDARAFLKLEID